MGRHLLDQAMSFLYMEGHNKDVVITTMHSLL